jgi:hypothetical protein
VFGPRAARGMTTDMETGQPLRSGEELVVKRYLPERWPEGSRLSQGEPQGRLCHGLATTWTRVAPWV